MRRSVAIRTAMALLATALIPTPSMATSSLKPRPVLARLVADMTRISPNEALTLVAYFVIEDGWRISWINPGQEGQATTVEIEAPEGFEVGDPVFLGPDRWESASGKVSYGYAHEAAVFFEVKPPAELEPGIPCEFTAHASWLARRDQEGHGQEMSVHLTLSSGEADQPALPDNREFLRPLRERLPQPMDKMTADENVMLTWWPPAVWPTLTVSVPDADELEFFPYPHETEFRSRERYRDESSASIEMKFFTELKGLNARAGAHGLLRVRRGVETIWYDFESLYEPNIADPRRLRPIRPKTDRPHPSGDGHRGLAPGKL